MSQVIFVVKKVFLLNIFEKSCREALVLQAAALYVQWHSDHWKWRSSGCWPVWRRLFVERVAECTFTAHAFLGAPLYHRNQKLLLRNAAGDS